MKLARREKYFVMILGGVFALILLLEILILPFFENRDAFKRGIQSGERQLEKLKLWAETSSTLDAESIDIEGILAARGAGFTLYSFLDKASNSAGISKDRIKYIQPSEIKGPDNYTQATVETKFEGITINQLSAFLYQIEVPEDLIFIKRIAIDDTKDKEGYLDCTIQISTYM